MYKIASHHSWAHSRQRRPLWRSRTCFAISIIEYICAIQFNWRGVWVFAHNSDLLDSIDAISEPAYFWPHRTVYWQCIHADGSTPSLGLRTIAFGRDWLSSMIETLRSRPIRWPPASERSRGSPAAAVFLATSSNQLPAEWRVLEQAIQQLNPAAM